MQMLIAGITEPGSTLAEFENLDFCRSRTFLQTFSHEFLALQKQLEGPHLYAVKVKTTVSGRKWFEGQFYSIEEQQLRYVLIFTSQYEF